MSMEPSWKLDRTSRISKVGMFKGDNGTHDYSEHQSGSNSNTQGDGWLDFFFIQKLL